MERLLVELRERGVAVIHAPSSCMDTYDGTGARSRSQSTPAAVSPPPGIDEWQFNSASEPTGLGSGERDAQGPAAEAHGVANGYPLDQRGDTGSLGDDTPTEHAAWTNVLMRSGHFSNSYEDELGKVEGVNPITHQTAALTIDHGRDYISDSGLEIFNILEHRNIDKCLLVGVASNMCILGRPFGLRQLVRCGRNVALVRDMTDCQYSPGFAPFVSHFEANRRMIAYIERYVCATITSNQVLGGAPFKFKGELEATKAIERLEKKLRLCEVDDNNFGLSEQQ